MPKVTQRFNGSDVTGTASLPAKAPRTKKKKDKPPATDPSTWPESKIDAKERITAGDIKQYYHLTPAVYSALAHSAHRTSRGLVTHLYNEREVERAAWAKYGGLQGYEAHLEALRQRQATQNPQKPFLTPSLRKKYGYAKNTTYDSWEPGPKYDWKLETLPPILQAVRDRFPSGSEWLWKRCNEVLDPDDPCSMDMELCERARVLGLVLDHPRRGALTPYPVRPPSSLVSSESADKLRAILAQAPRVLKDGNGEDEIVGLVRHETWHPEWDVWYDWTRDYYNEVFQALIDVVKQHGDEGWALARWEVYDTYAECVSGIWYSSWKGEGWSDHANWWLDASRTMGCKLGEELKALVATKIVTHSDFKHGCS